MKKKKDTGTGTGKFQAATSIIRMGVAMALALAGFVLSVYVGVLNIAIAIVPCVLCVEGIKHRA